VDEEGSMSRWKAPWNAAEAVALIERLCEAAAAGDAQAAAALERARPKLRDLARRIVEIAELEHDRSQATACERELTPDEEKARRLIAECLVKAYHTRGRHS